MKKYVGIFIGIIVQSLIFSKVIASETTLLKDGKQWHLVVDGIPFKIKGATFGRQTDPKNHLGVYMKDLQSMGVNCIRTWGAGEETAALLDSAHAYGIKVMVGIWLRHGRSGMEGDDNFNYLSDKKGIQAMFDTALKSVRTYKNHPVLLFFGVGN